MKYYKLLKKQESESIWAKNNSQVNSEIMREIFKDRILYKRWVTNHSRSKDSVATSKRVRYCPSFIYKILFILELFLIIETIGATSINDKICLSEVDGVIIGEHHWDTAPKELIAELIPIAKSYGFNTLAYEAPTSYKGLDEFTNAVKNYLYSSKSAKQEIITKVKKSYVAERFPGINNIASLSYQKLRNILYLFSGSNDIADKYTKDLKYIPATESNVNALERAKKYGYIFKGIDALLSQIPLSLDKKRVFAIENTKKKRDRNLSNSIEEIVEGGDKPITLIGLSHLPGITKHSSKKYLYLAPISNLKQAQANDHYIDVDALDEASDIGAEVIELDGTEDIKNYVNRFRC